MHPDNVTGDHFIAAPTFYDLEYLADLRLVCVERTLRQVSKYFANF